MRNTDLKNKNEIKTVNINDKKCKCENCTCGKNKLKNKLK